MKWLYECFGVSKQAFYKRLKTTREQMEQEKELTRMVEEERQCTSSQTGGLKLYRSLKPEMERRRIKMGRDKFYTFLRSYQLLVPKSKNYHVTTDSKHQFYKYPNLVQNKVPTRPEQLWVSDITYIKTESGHNYLALVTDAYSKQIMGYHLANHMKASLCTEALAMAVRNRKYPDMPLIHHSDRGFQYCSAEYVKFAEDHRMTMSMTEQYDPYENAVAERVNRTLKYEFGLKMTIKNFALAKKMVAHGVHIYNTRRLHWSLNLLTPKQVHASSDLDYKIYRKDKSGVEKLLH